MLPNHRENTEVFHSDSSNMTRQQVNKTSSPFAIVDQLPKLDAVIIRNLTYVVGRGRKKKAILNKINLTVPEGSIYGLLGPSGCGKTTMLRCVVGRIRPKSGSVLVFGFRPGLGQGEVPGRDVGYMPQDISIYEDFTIEETLSYFGKINRMDESDIKKRIEFLLQFLDLPSKRRLVVNLSGGQKRRVSLAAALVHSPPLLILDEPTVGVDPLLRQGIWQHLVTLTQTERISVIITTHYIEEARLANVVGLMRHGKILAEDSPDELMAVHNMTNLEDVFLKLCVTDSSRRATNLAIKGQQQQQIQSNLNSSSKRKYDYPLANQHTRQRHTNQPSTSRSTQSPSSKQLGSNVTIIQSTTMSRSTNDGIANDSSLSRRNNLNSGRATIKIHTGTNQIELNSGSPVSYINEAIENFSSEEDNDHDDDDSNKKSEIGAANYLNRSSPLSIDNINNRLPNNLNSNRIQRIDINSPNQNSTSGSDSLISNSSDQNDDYLAYQAINWASRRANALNYIRIGLDKGPYNGLDGRRPGKRLMARYDTSSSLLQWFKTLMAVTWKNYIRLRRNPPVLVFQFMLPAIQVILFCLCIGGEPFDVPVAIVNDEVVPKSSLQFLNALNKKIIRQVKYDNLTSAIEAVRRGKVWGALHIPDKYSENLQSRLIMGDETTNEKISNGTIRVYPDLTNLHLGMTLETTLREGFLNFARESLEEMGYDRSMADLPIQIGKPVYGTLNKNSYLEFMAPGVVISISYVMATGLTALAFILERRDGLLERSLISGVQTMQILLAHAINQVVVMVIQIIFVLGCTFFIFEIPSRGPFFWVVLLILLQGCTGMGFGLLVSAICAEENTAVMMVVGTFYTNLILAGIIWPIEAMPHWLRPLSYAQPQTLPTDSLRHILSRGWGITEPEVILGFAVTIGWLAVFLFSAGVIFKYSR